MNSALLSVLAAAEPGAAPAWTGIVPLLAMGVVFWFLLIRPQMQQQKRQKAKIEAIRKGDQVVTAGGLLGKVIKVDDNYVELELAPNTKVRALRATIADVVPPGGSAAAND